MRYRGVRRQGIGMSRFIIATLCLFSALDDRTDRTDVSRLPCVMIYFLCVCQFMIDWTANGCFLLTLTCCTMSHLYISLMVFIFWIHRSMHLMILLNSIAVYSSMFYTANIDCLVECLSNRKIRPSIENQRKGNFSWKRLMSP
jgi:uncharacterized membrane protein